MLRLSLWLAGAASRDKEVEDLKEQLAEAKWWLTQRPAWQSIWTARGKDDERH